MKSNSSVEEYINSADSLYDVRRIVDDQ